MSIKNIPTDRLILIPITLEIIKELINGSGRTIENLGIEKHRNWPTADTKDILHIFCNRLKECNRPTGFEFWMIVKKDSNTIIGDIGFKGQPDEDGATEIGYGLVEEERGKGFGLEALKAMIAWALSHENVKTVKAECLIENNPSARILEKAGMKEVDRDDELIYWEISK